MKRINSALLCISGIVLLSSAKPESGVRYLELDDSTIGEINIHPDGTVVSFPVKPTKVIIGQKNSFDIEYISNDIAIAPLSKTATSNLFVYLLGQRYSFSIRVAAVGADKLSLVRDPKEKSYQVELK